MAERTETDKLIHKTAVVILVIVVFAALIGAVGLLVYSYMKW